MVSGKIDGFIVLYAAAFLTPQIWSPSIAFNFPLAR